MTPAASRSFRILLHRKNRRLIRVEPQSEPRRPGARPIKVDGFTQWKVVVNGGLVWLTEEIANQFQQQCLVRMLHGLILADCAVPSWVGASANRLARS